MGSANEIAANNVAQGLVQLLKKNGVRASRVSIAAYQADAADTSAPIRVSYVAMRAHTDRCGRWPEDLTNTIENKHYANFGCSYQNNLAAQIANPADLLGPRKPGDIDAERRNIIIDDYRASTADGFGDVQY
jgi:pilus assembly protein CpaD